MEPLASNADIIVLHYRKNIRILLYPCSWLLVLGLHIWLSWILGKPYRVAFILASMESAHGYNRCPSAAVPLNLIDCPYFSIHCVPLSPFTNGHLSLCNTDECLIYAPQRHLARPFAYLPTYRGGHKFYSLLCDVRLCGPRLHGRLPSQDWGSYDSRVMAAWSGTETIINVELPKGKGGAVGLFPRM